MFTLGRKKVLYHKSKFLFQETGKKRAKQTESNQGKVCKILEKRIK